MKVKHHHPDFKATPLGNWADRRHLRRDDLLVRRLARKHGLPLTYAGIYLDWIRRGEA
jgi:hypothetical protein